MGEVPGAIVLALGAALAAALVALVWIDTRTRSLRRSEQQHRRVVEQAEQVLFQLDPEGRWTFLSGAWTRLTGLPVDAMIGRSIVDALHPDDRDVARRLCEEVIAGRKESCRQELRVLLRDGSARWTVTHARPVTTRGRLTGVTGTITDVTEHRVAQADLERAREVAERASEAKTAFLKSMSHEMRTPLNGVLGLMELLAATPLDPQQARYVAVARASAMHLSTLIGDILDLSRIEAGSLTLERSLFDLPDLIESTLDVVSSEAAAKRLRLSCTVTQDVPTWVIGDPGRLRQVLVSLLHNAVKFTDRGDVHLQAEAVVDVAARSADVRFEVQDTGVGLAADQIATLFEPFTPGDASSTRRHSGTGLGLTICKRLVDAMQGTIQVRSVEHAGATFIVTIPIEVADAAMVESQRAGDAALRVLAVLPDAGERADIGRLLDGWRVEHEVVADCEAARAQLDGSARSRVRFGVVLVDGRAPGAVDLGRAVRDHVPPPGLVWIGSDEGRAEWALSGITEEVGRPVRAPVLFDAIMQALVGSSAGPHEHAARQVTWGGRLRVLVAEDHDVNQLVIRDLLQGMGCVVDVVSDGAQAVDAVLAASYHVVLMDCQMPVLDGIEATRRIRHAVGPGKPPRIIALTANANAEDRAAALAAGMDAYLTKPVRGTVLQRTLQRLLAIELPEPAPEPPPEPIAAAPPPAAAVRPVVSVPLVPLGAEPGLAIPDADDILDPEEVLRRCNRNPDLGARTLQLFAESLPAELEALEAAAAAGDAEALGRIAHKVRGAAATLAAVRLAGAISGIELFLKYGDGGPLSDLIADVRHESALLLGVVPRVVRRLVPGPTSDVTDGPD